MPKGRVSKCFLRHAALDFPGELVKGVMTEPHSRLPAQWESLRVGLANPCPQWYLLALKLENHLCRYLKSLLSLKTFIMHSTCLKTVSFLIKYSFSFLTKKVLCPLIKLQFALPTKSFKRKRHKEIQKSSTIIRINSPTQCTFSHESLLIFSYWRKFPPKKIGQSQAVICTVVEYTNFHVNYFRKCTSCQISKKKKNHKDLHDVPRD